MEKPRDEHLTSLEKGVDPEVKLLPGHSVRLYLQSGKSSFIPDGILSLAGRVGPNGEVFYLDNKAAMWTTGSLITVQVTDVDNQSTFVRIVGQVKQVLVSEEGEVLSALLTFYSHQSDIVPFSPKET